MRRIYCEEVLDTAGGQAALDELARMAEAAPIDVRARAVVNATATRETENSTFLEKKYYLILYK